MTTTLKRLFSAIALSLITHSAQAHTANGSLNGWHDGFNHPLHGWDHLIVMIGVGLWAAQQRGRAVWSIPLTFVGVMALGGVVGVTGISVPGVELAILVSVAVFSVLVARRIHFRTTTSLLLVGFFAFFHGFAHGAEMPGSASIVTFGLGFILATILLHALGLVTARLTTVLVACLVGTTAIAQQPTNAPVSVPAPEPKSDTTLKLPTMVVTGRADSLLGIASSATQGTVGVEELASRPILRAGEVLETIPGVIITQHAGGGKANQYFLRGFNLDHGTDISLDLDGMPLNLVSHAHGPGYADFNIVIPELVQRVIYEKGPYYAADGDFSSAAAGHLEFFKTLPDTLAIIEAGMYGYGRLVIASSPKLGDGYLLYAVEACHDDGPWVHPDDYQKFNGMLTYSLGDNANGFSVTARGYHGKWNSSDQIAESAAGTGLIPTFGSLDNSDGGNSQRYSLQAEWHRADDDSAIKIMAYTFYYDLDLYSDFTYFLTDTNRGDQFEQKDHRIVSGLKASHTLYGHLWDRDMENTFGLQIRNDAIDNGVYQTQNRIRVDKLDTTGTLLPSVMRQDSLNEFSAGFYYENKIQWADKIRTILGVRGDVFNFDVTDFNQANASIVNPVNSGSRTTAVASPKASLILGPWARTEFYLNGGFGFHSDDARGTAATINPDGTSATSLNGLFQTRGAEVGLRTLAIPNLQSSLSLWYLRSDSELLFEGDTGNTVNTQQPSDRYGIEFANYYTPTKWLTLDLDYANSIARFTFPDGDGGKNVPESVGQVLSAGITVHDLRGFSASLRLRYFGPRNLISTGDFRSSGTILLNLGLGYQINKTWSISAEILNLLDRRDHDIDYYYESRITPSSASATQIHYHPVEPVQARFAVTARF